MSTDKLLNRRVYIRIINKCNKDCSFCFYKNDPKQPTEISLDTVKRIVRKEFAMHDKSTMLRVGLSGGEPTMHPDYKTIATYIANIAPNGVLLSFETNGTKLNDPEFLEFTEIFKKENAVLKISFNSDLIDSDPEWLPRLIEFNRYAVESKLKFMLGIRYRDEDDKQRLEKIIEDNNLKSSWDSHLYFPIQNVNLYRDGTLPNYDISWIVYDCDGEKIYEFSNQ